MIEIFKRNVNKAKHIALFGLIITSVLLVTVVYKSDEKIRKRSEIISDTMRAGYAIRAKFPPLTRDKCFLRAFISLIVAPQAKKVWFASCRSLSVNPSAGETRSAEPPPDTQFKMRVPLPASRTAFNTTPSNVPAQEDAVKKSKESEFPSSDEVLTDVYSEYA